ARAAVDVDGGGGRGAISDAVHNQLPSRGTIGKCVIGRSAGDIDSAAGKGDEVSEAEIDVTIGAADAEVIRAAGNGAHIESLIAGCVARDNEPLLGVVQFEVDVAAGLLEEGFDCERAAAGGSDLKPVVGGSQMHTIFAKLIDGAPVHGLETAATVSAA